MTAALASVEPTADEHEPWAVQLQNLRETGADRLDPVRFRFIEVLARQAEPHQGRVRSVLDAKLELALAGYQALITRASSGHHPVPVAKTAPRQPETLGDLVRSLQQQELAGHGGRADVNLGTGPSPSTELKSVQQFRTTWSRLSVERQVAQAMARPPQNAGPINSHMVVLRTLALMRETAPAYLDRFVSYVDTLLCLDQGATDAMPSRKPPSKARSVRK